MGKGGSQPRRQPKQKPNFIIGAEGFLLLDDPIPEDLKPHKTDGQEPNNKVQLAWGKPTDASNAQNDPYKNPWQKIKQVLPSPLSPVGKKREEITHNQHRQKDPDSFFRSKGEDAQWRR